jgi:hypothetical protein
MQFRMGRETIIIIPETDQDVAYLEDTLGLRKDGDVIKFERLDNQSNNWIKFRVESYTPADHWHDDEACDYRREGKPKRRVDTSRFKDIADYSEEPTGDYGTLVDTSN